ncbi:BMP family ABC transporter substrate-binding protein [Virgibacillus ainsalahensis]
MKKTQITFLIMIVPILLTGCADYFNSGNIQNVGMLTDGTIDDQGWAEKGYKGLQNIEETYDVDVFYKENITTEEQIRDAVDEFLQDGVNLVFGNSNMYGNHFAEIASSYPDVHFVYFNGGYVDENVTSLNFNSHAMGFFAGMLAGKMSTSDQVGIIAAFEWQPEIEGFYEGVNYENPSTKVTINFLNDWNESDMAIDIYENMREEGVDVFYPAGGYFNTDIVNQAKEDGLYAIGYIVDQSETNERTVLTSTIQHVDKLYELAAEEFNAGNLSGNVTTYDFQDGAISLGKFSPHVPDSYQQEVNEAVEEYIDTGLLPNEY